MLSALLAWFLIWVLYLWIDRRRLQRLLRTATPPKSASTQKITSKPASTQKPSLQPQFPNSKPTSNKAQFPSSPPGSAQQTPSPKPQPEINLNSVHREAASRKEDLRKVSPATQNHLYRLVHGDRAMAERLIKHSRSRHPDRSEQWVWEKTIQDLERDRGCR